MANDIITQLQGRNETLTQAIARYGSLNLSTLQTLSTEKAKITRLTQQLTGTSFRREESDKQRIASLEKTQQVTGQAGKLLNVEAPDWNLPYKFLDSMANMATKGGMDNATRDELSLKLRNWSLDFNQDQNALPEAATTMIAGGIISMQDLNRYLPEIGKAATATRDSTAIWAQAALITHDRLNISPADFPFAQNMMYSVAKGGGSSVEEQARWINAFAGKTGLQGKEGLAELTASMQIAMKNASSAVSAAQNFDHFLQSTFSKETDNWFSRQGVDLRGSLMDHQQNGIGVTEAMIHVVQMQLEKMNPQILETLRQTMKIEDLSMRGDALKSMVTKFNLGEMFSDAKTLDFIAPMLANQDEYRRLKTVTTQAGGSNLIDNDLNKTMTSPIEQTKALQMAFNDLWLSIGLKLLPVVGELAQSLLPLVRQFSVWLRENPALVDGIAKMVGIIWLFDGALSMLKLGANIIASPFIRLIDIFLKVKASLALGGSANTALSILKSLGRGAKTVATLLGSSLVSGLKLVGQTVLWLGRVLLMNPIGLVITAIAGAAYLIYRYWEPISDFFSGLWARIKTAFDGGIGGITALILNWSPLGLFYNVFAGVLDWFGIELPQSFSQFGSGILDSLINGILNALPFLKSAIEQIKSLIPDWAQSTLGISTQKTVAAVGLPGVAGTALAHTSGKQQGSGVKTTLTPPALPGKLGVPSRAQSNVQVHFSPQVTVQGSGVNAARDINNVLALSKRELERMINDVMAQQQRREYA
ncbi:phage tail tape measure protein [Scandinavium goeteborgense]|uniref:phage tail tape measure protein n=1 Tax=Scandinavium goeteborgense TaxID=1851514 RepID=UPI0021665594|nr:phage tail tape measure protein [Scandinavium goeteborgense]MCS2152649.1 phage tail tape measure protein [Scandinavium goeteborgense]